MSSSKLEELKQKLLSQQALKEKTPQIKSSQPQPPLNPPPQKKEPDLVQGEGHPEGREQTNSKEQPAEQLQGEVQQGEDPSEDGDHVAELPAIIKKSEAMQSEVAVQLKEEKAGNCEDQKQPCQERKGDENHPQKGQSEPKVDQGLVGQKPNDEANLELHDKHNFSCSVDQELKPSHPPIASEHLEGESKQDQKKRKIVLKELEKITKCIVNLKSSIKGLQILEQKMKQQPILKQKLQVYLRELKAYQSSD